MFVLRLTSDALVRGVESDDGFTIGRFSLRHDLPVVADDRPRFGGRARLRERAVGVAGARPPRVWATLCGAIGGAAIIHSDGIDFNRSSRRRSPSRCSSRSRRRGVADGLSHRSLATVVGQEPQRTALASALRLAGEPRRRRHRARRRHRGDRRRCGARSQVGLLRRVQHTARAPRRGLPRLGALTAIALVDLTDDVRTLT